MKVSRRDVLRASAVVGGAAAVGATSVASNAAVLAQQAGGGRCVAAAFDALKPMGDRVKPIATEEFQARIAKAQKLMRDATTKVDVLYVAPGTTLYYFTGVHWWPSERILALLIPGTGDPMLVCPAFEEARLREQLRWPIAVRTWEEDDNPFGVAAKWIGESGGRLSRVAWSRPCSSRSTTECARRRRRFRTRAGIR